MSKIERMRGQLSKDAREVLAGMRGSHPGAVVTAGMIAPGPRRQMVMIELRAAGVIGDRDGLTIIGSGLAAKLQSELLDSLF